MRQIFFERGKAVVRDVPSPLVESGMVLVKVFYSFVSSGTEGAALKASGKSLAERVLFNTKECVDKVSAALKENGLAGTLALIQSKKNQLMEIGYSCAGQVVAVGSDITNLAVGDYVACAGAGFAHHAEFVAVPKNLVVRLVNEKKLKEASITTIGAIALQGVRRANLSLGEKVCIVGLGLLGQLTVQLAKASGCEVIGIDIDDSRLELATACGADKVFNPLSPNVKNSIIFATKHYGVDATIVTAAGATGELLAFAMEITRRKGKVVLVGDVKIDIPRDPLYNKEIDFLISCSYGPGRYDHTYEQGGQDYPYAYVRWTENRNMQLIASMIEQEKLLIKPLISHEFDSMQAEQAYEYLAQKKNLGLVISYKHEEKKPSFKPATALHTKKYDYPLQNLNVAVIGVGGFTKVKLLPLLTAHKKVKLSAIIDASNANALNVATQYGIAKSSNNYKDILTDVSIHAVVIATPHSLHAQQALDCLQAGKAVFVEKPAVVTFEELKQLKSFLAIHPQSIYTVDFNRSWAPHNQAIKKVIQERTTPLVMVYRMNAGFIPLSHWVQSAKQGGRIIGEACHIFELFLFLTDAQPISVAVNIAHKRDDFSYADNVSVQIQFDDGSVGTLIYTALGNNNLEKERMEIFYDGKSIVLNDYKELTGYGLPSTFNQKSNSQDKGHKDLLEHFINIASNPTEEKMKLVAQQTERMLRATELSLIIDNLAHIGGGYEVLVPREVVDFDSLNHKKVDEQYV